MNRTIDINHTSCIKCGKCIRVCPSQLFSQKDSESDIEASSVGCIACGHCVACCPTDSVIHSDFPAAKVHHIDYDKMPTAEQIMLLCKSRRSNRAFSKKEIPTQMLDMILEAAHRAPTASNMQGIEFTLVTSPEKLSLITDFTIGVFRSISKKLNNPLLKPLLKTLMPSAYNYLPIFKRLITEHKKGNDGILRSATAVLLIHSTIDSNFIAADANLAYQNGSLLAESLGVSQFYTGFVCAAIKQSKDRTLEKALGIKGKIYAGMGLGMPSFRFPNYIDKKDIVVNKI